MSGSARRAFIPIAGLHHASRDHAAGFCVFNDCGVAIEMLRRRHGMQRIAYVDIDAHHGDGVFYAFEDDPDLLFADLHEDGRYLYPGTGMAQETGVGPALRHQAESAAAAGRGRRASITRPGSRWRTTCAPGDPSSSCSSAARTASKAIRSRTCVSREDAHAHAAARLCAIADELGHGRVVGMGGGGYNRRNLARAWTRVVEAFVRGASGVAGAMLFRLP